MKNLLTEVLQEWQKRPMVFPLVGAVAAAAHTVSPET